MDQKLCVSFILPYNLDQSSSVAQSKVLWDVGGTGVRFRHSTQLPFSLVLLWLMLTDVTLMYPVPNRSASTIYIVPCLWIRLGQFDTLFWKFSMYMHFLLDFDPLNMLMKPFLLLSLAPVEGNAFKWAEFTQTSTVGEYC